MHNSRKTLNRAAQIIEALIFSGLFIALIAQVVARFVLDRPAPWTEETAAILFIWTIFWGAAFTTPLSSHVTIDLIESRLGPRGQRISEAIGLLLVGTCFAWALPGIVDYVGFMDRETTPVTGIKLSWVFSVFVAFAFMVILRCAKGIWRPERNSEPPPA